MDAKNSPFSIYDLIGYFIPGASLLLLAGALLEFNGIDWLQQKISKVDSLEAYLPFFLAAYVAGQANALLSSLTIERYAIYSHGYPSKTLLNLRHKGYWAAAGSRLGCTLVALLGPIAALDWVFGRLFGLAQFSGRPLDKFLDTVLRRRIYRLLRTFNFGGRLVGSANSSEFFRLIYHYAVESAPAHLPKMQNYVALFGFFRAFSLIALLSFWVQFSLSLLTFDASAPVDWKAVAFIASFAFLAYLFFVGFLKFYRRFSLEALMAAAVVFERPQRYKEAPTSGAKADGSGAAGTENNDGTAGDV